MRILQISPVAPPYKSGMSGAASEMARAIADCGVEVTFVSAIGNSPIEGVIIPQLHSYRVPGAGFLAFTPALFSMMRKFDLVHLHYPCFGNAWMVRQALRFDSLPPLVVTYHMDAIGRGVRAPLFALHAKTMMPGLLRRAAKIAVSSADYADSSYLARYPELMSKVTEIPFGIDTHRFTPAHQTEAKDKNLIRNRCSIGAEEPVLLFVGGLDEAHYFKGLHVLFRAMQKIPRATLLVVGSGGLLKQYARQAHDLNIDERVIFAGRVTEDELPQYFRAADVFVLPSIDRSEAYGLVLTEAAASGVPAVASALPGVRTVVKDETTGLLVPPNDPFALASAINRLLNNPEERKKMGEAARAFAASRTWRSCAEQYLELYKQACVQG